MLIKAAINGYGRIGRNILRALYEREERNIQIISINAKGDLETNEHLTRYDTTHGRFSGIVQTHGSNLLVNGHPICMLSERDPERLPWKALGVQVVYECTGAFTQRSAAAKHLKAGAKKVIISAPGIKRLTQPLFMA